MVISPGSLPGTLSADEGSDEGSLLRSLQGAVVGFSVVFFGFIAVRLVNYGAPYAAQLHFNAFALLPTASFISLVVALVLVCRVKHYSTMLLWLSLLLLGLAIWSGIQAMVWLGATPAAVRFWAPLGTIGVAFVPSALFMFALTYTNSRKAQQPLIFLSVMLTSLLVLYGDAQTNLIDNYNALDAMQLTPWGYVVPTGPAYGLFAAWFLVLGVAALAQLNRFARQASDSLLRRQAHVIAIAVLIPVVGGGITDALLPSLHVTAIPPLGAVLTAVMGLVFSYGTLRYRYFAFTPNIIAGQILATINEAVLGLQPDMRITYANAAAERLLGLPTPEMFKFRLTDFLTQQLETAQLKGEFHRLMAGKDFGLLNSVDLRTPSGSIMTAKMSITKVVGEGQPYGYVVVLTDITLMTQATLMIEHQVAEQTQAVRETKAQLLNSINSLSVGFVITDTRPEVILVNNVAHKLFCGSRDHSPAACTVVTLAHIQKEHIVGTPLTRAIQNCIDSSEPQRIKTAVFNHRTWRIFISPMLNDESHPTGTAIIIQDITEEQILSRSRDEFFSIASHELRTPLTAIKGNASLMMEYFADALKDPSLHEMVEDIHESSERLITIVNDFLDVSRLEQGRVTYQFEEVPLVETIEKIIYEMSATAKQAKVSLQLGQGLRHQDDVPNVIVDKGRLKQIVYNLIGNAVKFTEKGSVTVDATVSAHHIKIMVTDTGRGIPVEMQPLLFHKFQQAGESLLTRDSSKGTGLGLYISRLLARGMGGSLVLERSVPGKGSTFALTLPVASAARLKKLKAKTEVKLPLTTAGS